MRVFEQGDDNDCPIPAAFVYADGMPIMVNENVYLGLKVVNGSTSGLQATRGEGMRANQYSRFGRLFCFG